MRGIAMFCGMAKRTHRKDDLHNAGSPELLLEELVKYLARRAAERDDALSRKSERNVRHPGGKRDSK